jgi:hypothetical protein
VLLTEISVGRAGRAEDLSFVLLEDRVDVHVVVIIVVVTALLFAVFHLLL